MTPTDNSRLFQPFHNPTHHDATAPNPTPVITGPPSKPLRGFEPRTYALRKHRSTAELKWRPFSSKVETLGA